MRKSRRDADIDRLRTSLASVILNSCGNTCLNKNYQSRYSNNLTLPDEGYLDSSAGLNQTIPTYRILHPSALLHRLSLICFSTSLILYRNVQLNLKATCALIIL